MLNILITGGSKGIGLFLKKKLKDKHNVFSLSRRNLKDKQHLKCDVSKPEQVRRCIKKLNKIDILINNASITKPNHFDVKSFDETIKTNLSSVYYCSHFALDKLKKSKNPKIINISSINAYLAFPNNPSYVASKGGVNALTRALALDYSKFKIRVNSVSLGYFKLGMSYKSYKNQKKNIERKNKTILNQWGDPIDIYYLIEYLISNRSNYITGTDIKIDGGWTAKGL